MQTLLSKSRRLAIHWLYPEEPRCLGCGAVAPALTAPYHMLCRRCEAELGSLALARMEAGGKVACPAEGLAFVSCAFAYRGIARTLVHRLKYDHNRLAAVPLAAEMTLLPAGEEDVIAPIPTTKKRERARGFNQSAVLARRIAKAYGMEMDARMLQRTDEHAEQSRLSADARRSNLRNCMRASAKAKGRRILLIDDVYTTGATAAEAARALLAAGAVSVGMFAACKAGLLAEEGK